MDTLNKLISIQGTLSEAEGSRKTSISCLDPSISLGMTYFFFLTLLPFPLCAQGPIAIDLKKDHLSNTEITRKQRDEKNILTLSDAFAFESGVDLRQSGSLGTPTQLRIRGGEQRHTKVFFEGVPLQDASNYDGSAQLDHLVLSVPKIALTKGGFGGSIALESSLPHLGFHGQSASTLGSWNTFAENTELAYGGEKFALRAAGDVITSQSEHNYTKKSGQKYYRNYKNTSGSGSFYIMPTENHQIKAFANTINGDNNLDVNLYPGYTKTHTHLGIQGIKSAHVFGDRDHHFQTTLAHTHSARSFKGNGPGDIFKAETYFANPEGLFYLNPNKKTALKAGLVLQNESSFTFKKKRQKNTVYAALSHQYQGFDLSGLGHFSNVKDKPLTFTLEGGYTLKERPLRTFMRIATDLERPSLWMLYDKNYGNPSLKPEKSKAFEVGAETTYQIIAPECMLFGRNIEHFLDYNPLTNRYENTHKAFVRGLESKISLKASDSLSFVFSYTHTFVKKTPQKLRSFIPKNSVNSKVRYAFSPNLIYTSEANLSDRRQISTPQNVTLPVIWNHTLAYKPISAVILKAGITNALNARFEESYQILAPRRAFFCAGTFRF